VLFVEAAWFPVPLTSSLAIATLMIAASLLPPVKPLDGAFLGRVGAVAGLGILAVALLILLGWPDDRGSGTNRPLGGHARRPASAGRTPPRSCGTQQPRTGAGFGGRVATNRRPELEKVRNTVYGYAPREQTPALWKTVNTLSQADFERLLRDTRLIVATALGGVCG